MGLERLWAQADACTAVVTVTANATTGWHIVRLVGPGPGVPYAWWSHPQLGDDCFLALHCTDDPDPLLHPVGIRNLPREGTLLRYMVRTMEHVLAALSAATTTHHDLARQLTMADRDGSVATTPLPRERDLPALHVAALTQPVAALAQRMRLAAFYPVLPMTSADQAAAALDELGRAALSLT